MTGRPAAPDQVVAAFDVDGTITRHDCVRPFLERVAGRRGLARAIARRPVASLTGALRRDRDAIKEIVVGGVLRGRSVADVEREGRRFAEHVHAELLRGDVVERLRWHQRMGHRTVMVSASLRPYLEPLAAALGIERAVCTDVVRDAADPGCYGDRLDGGNCRAEEKAVRLRAWLADEGLLGAELWAYGDSRGDRELLAMAHHPVWVAGTTVRAVPDETDR